VVTLRAGIGDLDEKGLPGLLAVNLAENLDTRLINRSVPSLPPDVADIKHQFGLQSDEHPDANLQLALIALVVQAVRTA
jgi:hypothetical protein